MSDFFQVVSRDVAQNPVARAIAKRKIESAIRTFLIDCYFFEDGTTQGANYMAASKVLVVAIRICETTGADEGMGVLRGALSCCEQASRRGFVWKRLDAVAIDAGLTKAMEVINSASALAVTKAWLFANQLERDAEAA